MRHEITVRAKVQKICSSSREVIMAATGGNADSGENLSDHIRKGSLIDFHRIIGHLNSDDVERLAEDPALEIEITDRRSQKCLICAQGKWPRSLQSKQDSGEHSPIDRIDGVVCSDLKGPMTPRDRLGNRYMINFVDSKSNYAKGFLAKTKDVVAKQFEISWSISKKNSIAGSMSYAPIWVENIKILICFARAKA
uniref:AlNc14C55G4216 protein n=1 Tax=Albugo laibachii Nc14 TaxID=890382 RepID=F0WC33_9STRA|nr:AlNc14C55G4216 [Albugo laibachii Nc14]|eukprot:CCA18745.1 AlNc14C55G4216 [Albugo laibachii Nc14]